MKFEVRKSSKSFDFFLICDKYSLKKDKNTNNNTNAQQIHLELLTMQWSEYVCCICCNIKSIFVHLLFYLFIVDDDDDDDDEFGIC